MRNLKPRPEADAVTIRGAAMDLLARREHSAVELTRKLLARGFDAEAVAGALAVLASEGLQSDARFAETFVYSRFQRGAGPARIRAELRARGVGEGLIEGALVALDAEWLQQLRAVRARKFGPDLPGDFRERARQMRFLQQRGFSNEQIGRLFREVEPD
jgi:regulatory protein